MKQLSIHQGNYKLNDIRVLSLPLLTITEGENWAFVGTNGSGKSALACALCNELIQLAGEYHNNFNHIIRLSFEKLQKLVNDEWQRNNTDLLSANEEDSGSTTAEIILDNKSLAESDHENYNYLTELFGIAHLLNRRFKYLSTGETRKTILCHALMSKPDLLILDEPFDGLDVKSREQLAWLLAELSQKNISIVTILNRFDEIPQLTTHVGVLSNCSLNHTGLRQEIMNEAVIAQLAFTELQKGVSLPKADQIDNVPPCPTGQPLIILNNGYVHYNDRPIIDNLTWQVNPGEHWQIVGPNGAGKSTLLNLITGDHPQGYSNDLILFGRKRGSGETIWDIKRHIGYVSSSLHMDYRVNISVRNVILSGYFDSIGVYQAPSDKQQHLTQQWLDLLGLTRFADQTFQSLSWGQQRLTLIARALVKHPTLLILDEPLQGLDSLNRQLVRRWIDLLISEGNTQLLFVSHHAEDAPDCITNRLSFIPNQGSYNYQFDII